MRLLSEHRVVAVPGVGYGRSCDGFIRVGMGTESMERAKAALRAVQALIQATRRPQAAAEPARPGTRAAVHGIRGLTMARHRAEGGPAGVEAAEDCAAA